MRDYQTKANQGALPDSNSTTKYGAGEVNSLRTEAKTAVSRAGLTLAPQDGTGEETDQLAQALLINGVAAQAVQDSGAADAIILTPVSGSSGLTLPPDYTTLDGAEFSFFAAFDNATTTPTASIGQTAGTQFGAKTIVREDGTPLAAGDITTTVMTTLRRDGAGDRWLLVRGAGLQSTANLDLIIQDQKPQNTDGGTFTAGAWRTRDLNTVLVNNIPGASLSSNQITLPSGNYLVEWSAPANSQTTDLSLHQSKLYDTTGANDLVLGSSLENFQGASSQRGSNISDGKGYFTLGVTSVIELQHRCAVTANTSGFGKAANFGVEVYSQIKITKV